MVQVRVGRSRQVPVLLDTGSVGLHIFAPAVSTATGSDVTVSHTPQSITYSGGSVYTGVEAYAVITVGSQSTAVSVPFALVEHATCTAAKPGCPTANGMSKEIAAREYGILGIGLTKAKTGLSSPLLAMPAALGETWSIHLQGHTGSLVLGASVPEATTDTTIRLHPEGGSAHGSSWADANVNLCFSVGPIRSCSPSLFDTGTFVMQLTGRAFSHAPLAAGTLDVLPGTQVAVSVDGGSRPFWTIEVGTSKSKNSVLVRQGAREFVNCGVQAFYAFTVIYDDVTGSMTFVPST
jgi:hypothetical protein